MAQLKVTIELEGTPPQVAAQKKLIEGMVKLPADQRALLLELSENPKAMKGLIEHKSTLLSFLQ